MTSTFRGEALHAYIFDDVRNIYFYFFVSNLSTTPTTDQPKPALHLLLSRQLYVNLLSLPAFRPNSQNPK
jgi:hypothetical protein